MVGEGVLGGYQCTTILGGVEVAMMVVVKLLVCAFWNRVVAVLLGLNNRAYGGLGD